MKILIIDDNEPICLVTKFILEIRHDEVVTITRPGELDEALLKFNPGLILLDIQLGGYDGRDLCRQIKTKPDAPYVILFSANAHLLANYENYGADATLAKPFSLKQLHTMVESFET